MAKLGREIVVTLANGRALRVRDARSRDARPLTRLLDAVAAEPEVTLLLLPGEATAREWRSRISSVASARCALLLVACVDGELVGNLGIWPDANPASAHVGWLGMSVDRHWRGMGVGGTLLEIAMEWAAATGCVRAALGVFPHNERAISFYEHHGFVREGVRRAQYRRRGEYHDEVLMARILTALP